MFFARADLYKEDIRKKIPADLGKHVLEGFKNAYPLVQWLRDIPLVSTEE